MFFDEVVLVTGGFDPIHSGHISYFNKAKQFSNRLIVGINSDDWLVRKKGQYFLPWNERAKIISNLRMVDDVLSYNDEDNSSSKAIDKCLEISKKVIFCNGGDRKNNNILEMDVFKNNPRVEFKFGVGGDDKMNSSSWILHGYFERQRKLLGI